MPTITDSWALARKRQDLQPRAASSPAPCILSRTPQSPQKRHNRQLARGAKSMVAATYPLFSIRCGNHWYRNRARAGASAPRDRATGAGIRQQAASRGALLAAPGGAAHGPRELTGTVMFLSLAHLTSATGTITAAAPVDQRYLTTGWPRSRPGPCSTTIPASGAGSGRR
jgi:hypothetical protein